MMNNPANSLISEVLTTTTGKGYIKFDGQIAWSVEEPDRFDWSGDE